MERNTGQGVKRIPLRDRRGGVRGEALVDESDFAAVDQFRWSMDAYGYAVRNQRRAEGGRQIKMHRELLGVADPKEEVDHRNGDRLDNRRANLRITNHAGNQQNRVRLNALEEAAAVAAAFRAEHMPFSADAGAALANANLVAA